MYDEDKPKKKKTSKKPGEWKPLDILLALFGLVALAALTVAGFKAAKWVVTNYL